MSFLSEAPFSRHGFTLVEVLTAVAILSLIATIGYPSFRSHILKVHRIEATGALINIADRMDNFYLDNKTYTNDLLALGFSADPFITENGYYSIDVRDNGGGGGACPIAICFQLEAAAIGAQADDTDCGLFALNSAGVKTAEAADNSQNNSCW